MPIDINAILQPFLFNFQFECRHLSEALQKLGDYFKEQVIRAASVVAATRDFPELSFTGDALDVALTDRQARELGSVLPHHEPMMDMIRQEFLLSGFLRMVGDMTGRIRASMEALRAPDMRMFDINRPRGFGEVFGILGVLSRGLFASMRSNNSRIRVLPFYALFTRLSLLMSFGYDTAASSSDSSSGGLDTDQALLAGVLTILPAAVDWVNKVIAKVDLGVRLAILNTLQPLEQSIYQIRVKVIRFFAEDFVTFGQELSDFLLAFSTVFIMNVDYLGRFVRIVVGVLVPAMIRLIREIREFANSWIHIIAMAAELADRLWGLLAPKVPLTGIGSVIGDLLFPDLFIANPGFVMSPFPDITPVFGPLKARLSGALDDIHTDVSGFVNDAFGATSGMMSNLSRSFSGAIPPLLAMGGIDRWRGLAADADAITGRYFHNVEQRSPNQLGEAFDQAVAAHGIDVAGAAVGAYLVGVAEWWRQRRTNNPTSPHILAERARRLRVKLPRLTVRLRGARVDDADLPAAVAARLKEVIESAWSQGLALDTGAPR